MNEAQGISFSLYVDPTTKKTFVREVAKTAEDAATAATAVGKKVKPLGEIFSGRSLLQLAVAAYALRRLGMAADEPSEKLRKASKEAKELAATIGNELQAAAGEMAAGIMPGIKALLELGAGFRGGVIGGAAFLIMMPRIGAALRWMGLAAGPWGAAIAAAFVLAGAALQSMGAKAAEEEQRLAHLRKAYESGTAAQIQQTISLYEKRLKEIQAEQAELGKRLGLSDAINESELGINQLTADRFPGLEKERKELNASLAILRDMVAVRDRLAEGGAITISDKDLTAGEKLDQINTALATQEMNLSEARAAAKKFVDEILKPRGELIESEAHQVALCVAVTQEYEKQGKELTEQQRTDIIRKKTVEEIKAGEAERRTILQFISGKTKEIGDQGEKQRATVFNRGRLEAQILDLVRQQGPAAELLYLIGVRRKLIAEGHSAAETHVLEIDKDIASLQQQIAQQAEQAAQKRKAAAEEGLSDEKRLAQEQLDRLTFQRTIITSLAELQGATEETLRARRIADLQKELGLRRLGYNELIAKQKELNDLPVGLDPKIDQQREGLKELIQLLIEQRKAAAEVWQPMVQGLEQATHRGALALTQMFTRGKMDAKRFAEDMLNIFEQMIAEMLGKAVFGALISLILSIFNPIGALAGGAGGGGKGLLSGSIKGMRGGTLPGTPNIPWPQPASQVVTVQMRGIERRLDAMTSRIEDALRAPVQGGFVTIKGSTLRVALVRETAAAETRKL